MAQGKPHAVHQPRLPLVPAGARAAASAATLSSSPLPAEAPLRVVVGPAAINPGVGPLQSGEQNLHPPRLPEPLVQCRWSNAAIRLCPVLVPWLSDGGLGFVHPKHYNQTLSKSMSSND